LLFNLGNDPGFIERLLETLHDGVYFVDKDRRITYWNRGAEAISGYSREQVLGSCCYDNILVHTNCEGTQLCFNGCPLAQTICDGQARQAEVFLKHRDGHRVPVRASITPLRGASGEIIGAVETFTQNLVPNAAIERARELEHLAYLDPTTDVANRRYAERFLLQHIEEDANLVAIFCDIDHLKLVNERFGRAAGDSVLKMVAQTWVHNLRSFDLVARWEDDEFIAALPGTTVDEGLWFAHRCRHLIRSGNVTWKEATIAVAVSVGVVTADGADTPQSLVRRAEALAYRSKTNARNRIAR
jgi:diguanylate cyclase (GGDEF)-like protein/PAS domain S-box-containing protein